MQATCMALKDHALGCMFPICSGLSPQAIPVSRAAADLEAVIVHFLPSCPQHLPVVLSRVEASDYVPGLAAPWSGTGLPYMP